MVSTFWTVYSVRPQRRYVCHVYTYCTIGAQIWSLIFFKIISHEPQHIISQSSHHLKDLELQCMLHFVHRHDLNLTSPSGRNRKFNWKNILKFIPTWYICTSQLLCNFAYYNLAARYCKLRNTLTLEYKGKILWCAPWKLNTALINHKRYIRTEFHKI